MAQVDGKVSKVEEIFLDVKWNTINDYIKKLFNQAPFSDAEFAQATSKSIQYHLETLKSLPLDFRKEISKEFFELAAIDGEKHDAEMSTYLGYLRELGVLDWIVDQHT